MERRQRKRDEDPEDGHRCPSRLFACPNAVPAGCSRDGCHQGAGHSSQTDPSRLSASASASFRWLVYWGSESPVYNSYVAFGPHASGGDTPQ